MTDRQSLRRQGACAPRARGGLARRSGLGLLLLWHGASLAAAAWRYQTGGNVRSSPALSGTGGNATAFAGSYDGYLYALDAATGALRWRYQTGGYVYSSPAVSKDDATVFVGSDDGYLYALDAATGALRWRYQTGGF